MAMTFQDRLHATVGKLLVDLVAVQAEVERLREEAEGHDAELTLLKAEVERLKPGGTDGD